jgi:hypothetical protein
VRWRPLMMSFCRFFGLGGELHPSRLAASDFMKFVYQEPMSRESTSGRPVTLQDGASQSQSTRGSAGPIPD